MNYLLDTNACIAHLRGTSANVTNRLAAAAPGEAANPAKNHGKLQSLFAGLTSLPFDDAASGFYGRLRAQLEAQGTPICPNDWMIAATALSSGLVLVTRNTSEFGRVSGLQIETGKVRKADRVMNKLKPTSAASRKSKADVDSADGGQRAGTGER